MVSDVFVSVIRAWRFTEPAGATETFYDLSAHRNRMGQLRGGTAQGSFILPWPPFPSRYWKYACNRDDYQNTPPEVLVGTLVPQRAMLPVAFESQWSRRRPLGEAFLQPFALATVVTVDLLGATSWDQQAAASQLDDALRSPSDRPRPGQPPRQLREGIRVADVEKSVPDSPWVSLALGLNAVAEVTLVSGLSAADADVTNDAVLLANHFAPGGRATTHTLTQSRGAIAVTAGRVGIALHADLPRATSRVKCLHHNHTLLLSQLASLGSIMEPACTMKAEPFRRIAARVLNYNYRGEAIPNAGVYKSRAAASWLEKKNLLVAVDRVNSSAGAGLPQLAPLSTATTTPA
jgi:hypothetical protein